MAHTMQTVQRLLDAKSIIEQALPDDTPEERLQMVGLLLIGPKVPVDRRLSAGETKGDQLIRMLRRPQGATLQEVIDTFDLKKNSAYARISVETRRRDLKVEHRDGRYRVHA